MLVNNDSKSPNDGSALRFVLKTRVNLLDFPKFGGVRGLDKVKDSRLLSSPYFADIRYVWNTPVLYSYPSMRNEVLNSIRYLLLTSSYWVYLFILEFSQKSVN